jgi:hypothetical protein
MYIEIKVFKSNLKNCLFLPYPSFPGQHQLEVGDSQRRCGLRIWHVKVLNHRPAEKLVHTREELKLG